MLSVQLSELVYFHDSYGCCVITVDEWSVPSLFIDVARNALISSEKVKIANGSLTPTSEKGNIWISKFIILESNLHVPKLACNLLSVRQLTKQANCCAKFLPSHIVFQDLSSRMIKSANGCTYLITLKWVTNIQLGYAILYQPLKLMTSCYGIREWVTSTLPPSKGCILIILLLASLLLRNV